jgi:hypothetical protein
MVVASHNDMNDHQDLTSRICQMREAGESIDQIVSTLHISWEICEAARRIVRKLETEAVLSARSKRFMEEIRKADDLDREWKVGILMQALRPKAITQTALIRHYEGETAFGVSLRRLLDLTIPAVDPVKPGFLIAPILAVRCVGIEGFWSMVLRLTESDLGERCNSEWRGRLMRIGRCSRIHGGRRWWSKPCVPPEPLLPFIARS